MTTWVDPTVPAFAVVGRVNTGKTSVLATLLEIDDNEIVRISPTPGETTRCQIHKVVFGGKECVRFIDTPGFSRPIEALKVIRSLHREGMPHLQALEQFVREAGEDFGDEKRLLEPLLEGAGVLYVVDPSKPLRDDFLAEMEILRWTGKPRLALLNRRKATADLVIFVSDNESWVDARGGRGTATMREWNVFQQRNPAARLACIDVQPYRTVQASEREDILNVGGFSDQAFAVISEFARGELNANHWVGVIDSVAL